MPNIRWPVSRRPKKSRFQAHSGSSTASIIMLASNRLSSQRLTPAPSSAMSENHRKFFGP